MTVATITNNASVLAGLYPLLQRVARGLLAARAGHYDIQETTPGTFSVTASHTGKRYAVQYYPGVNIWTCNCPDARYRHSPMCKHVAAVWESGLVDCSTGEPHSFAPPF